MSGVRAVKDRLQSDRALRVWHTVSRKKVDRRNPSDQIIWVLPLAIQDSKCYKDRSRNNLILLAIKI
ncbi:hypothetical protein KXD40_005421 [Peronospora effusa]|nr:hypothetical protein KXD40_005421 [Peronospora effusa]